jgi:hypothetical protein
MTIALSERDFQAQVLQLATLHGWRHYHTLRSRGSDSGFPDLVLIRPPELLIVELKSERGRLHAAQAEWLAKLRECGVETHVWRPADFDELHARLRARVRAVA